MTKPEDQSPEQRVDKTRQSRQNDYDTPWKEAIELYFRDFMAFYFPRQALEVDWSQPYRFLNQELAKSLRNARVGKRIVDRLVEVNLLNGDKACVYIHIELQGKRETTFTERVFIYNYRIFDRFHRPVATLVILMDDEPGWRPNRHGYDVLGTRHYLEFPTVKLLDYRPDIDRLLTEDNPFALVTAAHLLSRDTLKNVAERYDGKVRLIQLLSEKAWEESKIHGFLGILDWLISLPEELNQQLWQELTQNSQRNTTMPFVSSFERYAIEKGRHIGLEQGLEKGRHIGLEQGLERGLERGLEQGLEQGLLNGERAMLHRLLNKRFGPLPEHLEQRLMTATRTQLECWTDRVLEARTLETVFDDLYDKT